MRKLVRADYEGRFDKINMLFSALEQYKTDNKLSSMAIPFLKFDTSFTSYDDAQIIKAKGFYPVYWSLYDDYTIIVAHNNKSSFIFYVDGFYMPDLILYDNTINIFCQKITFTLVK